MRPELKLQTAMKTRTSALCKGKTILGTNGKDHQVSMHFWVNLTIAVLPQQGSTRGNLFFSVVILKIGNNLWAKVCSFIWICPKSKREWSSTWGYRLQKTPQRKLLKREAKFAHQPKILFLVVTETHLPRVESMWSTPGFQCRLHNRLTIQSQTHQIMSLASVSQLYDGYNNTDLRELLR